MGVSRGHAPPAPPCTSIYFIWLRQTILFTRREMQDSRNVWNVNGMCGMWAQNCHFCSPLVSSDIPVTFQAFFMPRTQGMYGMSMECQECGPGMSGMSMECQECGPGMCGMSMECQECGPKMTFQAFCPHSLPNVGPKFHSGEKNPFWRSQMK